jgi:hypothetical protein
MAAANDGPPMRNGMMRVDFGARRKRRGMEGAEYVGAFKTTR